MKRIWGHGGEELLAHVGLIFNTVIGWNLEFEMGLWGGEANNHISVCTWVQGMGCRV